MTSGIARIWLASAMLFSAGAALADPMDFPAMSGPLSKNPEPESDAGLLGTVYAGGAIAGIDLLQDRAAVSEHASLADFSNAQIFVEAKNDWLELFVRAGVYALPSLGTPYLTAPNTPRATYGFVPEALAKVTLGENLSIEAGKLPALIGNEYAFTFQNMNVERGLLWNQTPSVSRGIQANYTKGPLTVSLSWNDGYYSSRFNWVTGLASYSWNGAADSMSLMAGANLGRAGFSSFVTPLFQNNSQIADLVYSHTSGRWTISPYVQLSHIPATPTLGIGGTAHTFGAAFLGSYAIGEEWAIAGRAEVILTGGKANVLYGPGSGARSLTLTPTFQRGRFFVRGEVSYVGLDHAKPGFSLGQDFAQESQTRVLGEAGALF